MVILKKILINTLLLIQEFFLCEVYFKVYVKNKCLLKCLLSNFYSDMPSLFLNLGIIFQRSPICCGSIS